MATTEQRIRDLALVIHQNYGDEAVAKALERVRNWRDAEDHPMAAVWEQVAKECRKLVIRPSRFAQASLQERMDDSAVNAGKRDDGERRREVVATLIPAKRKIHDSDRGGLILQPSGQAAVE
jgi:hypothetical protein